MLCHSHPFDMYVLGIRGSRIQGIGAAYDWTANAFVGPGTSIINSVNGSLHVHPGFAMKARDVLADVKKTTGIDLSVVRSLSTGGHSQGAAVAAVIALQTAGAGRKRVVTMVSSPPFLSWGSLQRFSELMASDVCGYGNGLVLHAINIAPQSVNRLALNTPAICPHPA